MQASIIENGLRGRIMLEFGRGIRCVVVVGGQRVRTERFRISISGRVPQGLVGIRIGEEIERRFGGKGFESFEDDAGIRIANDVAGHSSYRDDLQRVIWAFR